MKKLGLLLGLAVVVSLLASCTAAEPEVIEKEVTRIVTENVVETVIVEGTAQVVEREVTRVVNAVVTATPEPEAAPTVGGTFVYGYQNEPPTLDPHLAVQSGRELQYIGATLVTMNPEGELVPYLAESWQVSEDGLIWDFTLKQNVKFHDGTPLTAEDYAWSFNRAIDPATQSPGAGTTLGSLISAEALDDYTLRLTLAEPYYALLVSLDLEYHQPLSRAAVEQWGDDYGRHPVGVGPYMFKEWQTGEKVVLERNPDFDWGPDFVHDGPAYIETLEFQYIPEVSTMISALEAGDVDWALLPAKDVQTISDTGRFQILEGLAEGLDPGIWMNVSQPPFDDVRVRQAINLAVDRESLVKVMLGGDGEPQYGPISPVVNCYWPGVEYIGYGFDLEQAQNLMAQAGYSLGSDGFLQKDGQPFAVDLVFSPEITEPRLAELLQQQYRALGVDMQLVQMEFGALLGSVMMGDYQIGMGGYGHSDIDIMHDFFHSGQIGGLNISQLNSPELDELLDRTRTATDAESRQVACNAVQKWVVEQAVVVPLYTPKHYVALTNRLMGQVVVVPVVKEWLNDAYILP